MIEPTWLRIARTFEGLQEIPGRDTAPVIQRLLIEAGAWWRDDETPWCGLLPRISMMRAGYETPKAWYRAKAWLDWGLEIDEPPVGAVVVFQRRGGGHVGYVVGRDTFGRLLVYGGNQENRACVMPFERTPEGFRWPREAASLVSLDALPVLNDVRGPSSRSEA